MDTFLFAPTSVDEYLLPDDVDDAWGVRFVIPESLYEEVVLTAPDGDKIYGFIVQPDGPTRDSVTVLYCHGNGDNINRYWGRVELLWEMGYRVFIFDYEGYGRSEGTPSGDACYADGRTALEYILGRTDVNPDRIVYYGWSMGSFVATYLAADSLAPYRVVLECPPASATALVKEGTAFDMPGSFLTEFDFDNEKRIAEIDVPVLMLYGRMDEYLPYQRHALRIIAAAEGKADFKVEAVPDAGHEDLPERLGDRYGELLREFTGGDQ